MTASRSLAAMGRRAVWAAGILATSAVAAPAPGRYDATLCVSSAALAASCGPAEVDVRSSGAVWVQVSDIVYRLRISTAPSVVVVTQGTMQIDEFDAGAEWSGSSLRSADADKQVRYEVQVGSPRAAPKR
jgi:TRAP-type mannitol/chloroaromatic compound transport system substrate-binding protein